MEFSSPEIDGENEEKGGGGAATRLRQLEESVEAHPEDPSLHFDLGLLFWEEGLDFTSKEKAAEHFLISAKLNPQNAQAFKYLGHYYSNIALDSQRALKCYQRAVSLHPDDSDSGDALCQLFRRSGKENLELSSCNEASQKSPRAFWAFRRLGFLHLHHNRCSEAVRCLQHAIRGYPTSADLWEALGVAYQRLGMFTAAIKSYGRAIELEDTRVFALVESGNIFLMLGSFRKGIEQFQRALEMSPQNVSAKYGLASGLLSLSKESMNLGAFRWAASLLEDACEIADANTACAVNMSCVWKLLGDIQITYAKCFPWMEEDQNLYYTVETFNASMFSWKQTCRLFAMSARRSYQHALHLAPWQPNLYVDIAVTSDHICFMDENNGHLLNPWQLSEKMALGSLLLEGENHEFWVALGCLSGYSALKQHALIRGLQLDVSLAFAWAYLGKLYREEGNKKLARQAFDFARSIDPSLALPWVGMSADSHPGDTKQDDAFESCLRAVQILPLAEFQIGLAKLALHSGHLGSSQVFGAIKQAVQRAPQYAESHNLNGLVSEARSEYQSAVGSYRLARFAINISSSNAPRSHIRDITVNLARSLTRAGHAREAVQECESLKNEGMLGVDGMQIYALSLWMVGDYDLTLRVTRELAGTVSTLDQTSASASVSFICRLLYHISGLDSAVASILKMPKQLFESSKVSFIVSAIGALDQSDRLESRISNCCFSLSSHEEIRMEYLIAFTKLIKHGSEHFLGFQSGISHLKKSLHLYPDSTLIRNLLGHLLLSSEEWKGGHLASRCCIIDTGNGERKDGLKSGHEILGAGALSCYAIANRDPRFSFPTCGCLCLNGPAVVQALQKHLHQAPWNCITQYLLILNLQQKAREERYPQQLCVTVRRLILIALANKSYSHESMSCQYQKLLLLLCASEVNLQAGNNVKCIEYAQNASLLLLPNNYRFFGHLQLCRAYAAESNFINLQKEYIRCLELKTDYHIGWVCLKIMESQYDIQTESNIEELYFLECPKEMKKSWNMWMAVFNLLLGLIFLWNQDLFSAEELFKQACSLAGADACLFLAHGATCMELARQSHSSEFLSLAIRSLKKAHANSIISIPMVFLLLAQAEGSLGSKQLWEKNLRLEWYSWSPETRPAELHFQMHLLARQGELAFDPSYGVELCQSPEKWVLRAIHSNPSCFRYWRVLQKLIE
ncbi:hypothetical protein K2173_027790 [Erythroxylum novogranatense]|uniref:Tetratricopeptide repeat protein SKI3 n=1 Tax=Erythroxylum novogranatense TaxID=1862640 RepID=A0AAV8U2M6_9ROSI|nr:hypothetical protein K2173_027790 [Erythroxylum novogranatense]